MFNKYKLESLMNSKGWTRYRLAKESNLGQSTVHEIMSGKKKNPNSLTLQKLADALGVSIDDLMENDTDIPAFKPIKFKKPEIDLDTIPEEFTDPDEARAYIGKHQIFASGGFRLDLMDDEEVISFGNAILEQIRLVGYKYKK